jgi:hypothetical protein
VSYSGFPESGGIFTTESELDSFMIGQTIRWMEDLHCSALLVPRRISTYPLRNNGMLTIGKHESYFFGNSLQP